jgi:hypothetical protein
MAQDDDTKGFFVMTTWTGRREITIVVITFSLLSLVILPLFAGGLPCSDDTLTHFYRTVQLLVLAKQGAPFLQ